MKRQEQSLRKIIEKLIENMPQTKKAYDNRSISVKNNILRSIAFYLGFFLYEMAQ